MLFADEYLFFFFAQEHHNTASKKKKSLKMYLHSYLCGPVSFSTGSLKHFATITIHTFNLRVVCRIFRSPICRTV